MVWKFWGRVCVLLVAAAATGTAIAQDLVGTTLNRSQKFELGADLGLGHTYHPSLNNNFQDWGAQTVSESDGFPVRLGEQSIRFETREGVCGWDGEFWSDCENGRNRHELTSSSDAEPSDTDLWYSLSVFIPEEFDSPRNIGTTIFQFWSGGLDSWSFKYDTGVGFYLRHQLRNDVKVLVADGSAKGRWIDLTWRIRHSLRDTGSMTVWVDGGVAYDYAGRTNHGDDPDAPNYFKFGIYNTALGADGAPVDGASNGNGEGLPNLHLFFDEVRYARSCAELGLEDLGYDCSDFSYEGADRELVRQLQTALYELGCDVGTADGIIGRRTLEAAKNCRFFGPGELPPVLAAGNLERFVELYQTAVSDNMEATERLEIVSTFSEVVGGNSDNALSVEAKYGEVDLDFILVGNFSDDGTSPWLSILLKDHLEPEYAQKVTDCIGGRIQEWGDGTVHADLPLAREQQNGWSLRDSECFTGALPTETSEELNVLLERFQMVAATVNAEGYDGTGDEGLTRFLQRVADGEITVGAN